MSNPYEVPSASSYETKQVLGPPWEMRYMESYNYIFLNPEWMNTALMGGLCLLSTTVIPVLGQLVFMGYLYEVTEGLHRSNGKWYPSFDFGRFGEYLGRSIGPFLFSLVASIAMMAVMFGLFILGMVVFGAIAAGVGEDGAPIVAIFGFVLAMFGMFAAIIGFSLIATPAMLRSGLSGQIGDAFDIGWAINFAKKTWQEMIMVFLFFMVAAVAAEFIGLLMCIVGVFFTISLAMLMHAHLSFQLYRVYLSRGGEPIQMKPVTVATPVNPGPPQKPWQ